MMQTTTSYSLAEKFVAFASTCSDEERDICKLLLGLAAGGLNTHPQFATSLATKAFEAVRTSAARLQPYNHRIPANGIPWRGRPDFMSDETLRELINEAESIRPRAMRYDDHI